MSRNPSGLAGPGPFPASAPSEALLFARAITGNPLLSSAAGNARADVDYEYLEWLAAISPEHERRLRNLAENPRTDQRQREQLEWLADISPEHARQLRDLRREEVVAAEVRERSRRILERLELERAAEEEWDASKHPRAGGPPNAGWFASTGSSTALAPLPANPSPKSDALAHPPRQQDQFVQALPPGQQGAASGNDRLAQNPPPAAGVPGGLIGPPPAAVTVDVPHLFRLQKNPAKTPVMFKLSAGVGANGGVAVDVKEGTGFDRHGRQGGFPFAAVVAGAHTGLNAGFKDTDSVQVAVRAQDQKGTDVFHETNALPQGIRPVGATWAFTGSEQQQNMAASWATKGTLPASAVRVDVIVLYTDARYGQGPRFGGFGGDYAVVIASFTATRKNPQSPWTMASNPGDVPKPVRDMNQPGTPAEYLAAQQKTERILLRQTGYKMDPRPPGNKLSDTGFDIKIR